VAPVAGSFIRALPPIAGGLDQIACSFSQTAVPRTELLDKNRFSVTGRSFLIGG